MLASDIRHSKIRFDFTKYAATIAVFMHWAACLWWTIGRYEYKQQGFSWIAGDTAEFDNEIAVGSAYLKSLYWTVITMTSVGYGDVTPKTDFEIGFSTLISLAGTLTFSYIFGMIAAAVAREDTAEHDFRGKKNLVLRFLSLRSVPDEIIERTLAYYKHQWIQTQGFDEFEIMQELPRSIRADVYLHLYAEMLAKVPLFADCEDSFVRALVTKLQARYYPAREDIVRVGDVGREMFFLWQGECEVVQKHTGVVFKTFSNGSYFGEIALIYKTRRTATVRTTKESNLLVLTSSDLVSPTSLTLKSSLFFSGGHHRRFPGGEEEASQDCGGKENGHSQQNQRNMEKSD